MLRYVAPSGAPIRLSDLAHWAGRGLSSGDAAEELRRLVRERFGVRHTAFTVTGRAGLTLLLRALRRLAPAHRQEVVVPAYTCYSVAASVVKAGLRPRLVDVNPDTLDFDADELARTDFSRVLAIVATNLYGLPNDLPGLAQTARRHGVFLIDDAAQAMGATVSGRPSGSWGDAGLFSFDKGKNVSAIEGGMVVTNSDQVAAALHREMAGLPAPGAIQSGIHILKALAYFALLRPSLYGLPARIPQLGLGQTIFTTDFPLELADRRLVALGLVMMRHLPEFTHARAATASALIAGLARTRGLSTIAPRPGSGPAYLRLPILFARAADRQPALDALHAAGIGATASYPESLADVRELQPYLAVRPAAPGARSVAQRIATLPTHPFVTGTDVARIITTLEKGTRIACAA